MDKEKRHVRCKEHGAQKAGGDFSGHDLEVDDDFSGQAGNVFNLDLVAEVPLQLLQQRQGVVIIAKTHGFAGLQGR